MSDQNDISNGYYYGKLHSNRSLAFEGWLQVSVLSATNERSPNSVSMSINTKCTGSDDTDIFALGVRKLTDVQTTSDAILLIFIIWRAPNRDLLKNMLSIDRRK